MAFQFLKAQKRRIEQGILEQLGAASSSKDDASFSKDQTRYKRLEETLNRLNTGVLAYLSSTKRAVDDSREVATVLEGLVASDARNGVGVVAGTGTPNLAAVAAAAAVAARRGEALSSLARVHGGLQASVTRAMEITLMEGVVGRTGAALRSLPALKRTLEGRRQAATDYDSYVRRLEGAKAKVDGTAESRDAVFRAEAKVRASAEALAAITEAVSTGLRDAEEARAALVADACAAVTGCQIHFHRHAADALAPLLPLFPEAALVLTELGGVTAIAAAAATTGTVASRAGSGGAGGSSSRKPTASAAAVPSPPALGFATLRSAMTLLPTGAALPSRVAAAGGGSGGDGGAAAAGLDRDREEKLRAAVAASFAELNAAVSPARQQQQSGGQMIASQPSLRGTSNSPTSAVTSGGVTSSFSAASASTLSRGSSSRVLGNIVGSVVSGGKPAPSLSVRQHMQAQAAAAAAGASSALSPPRASPLSPSSDAAAAGAAGAAPFGRGPTVPPSAYVRPLERIPASALASVRAAGAGRPPSSGGGKAHGGVAAAATGTTIETYDDDEEDEEEGGGGASGAARGRLRSSGVGIDEEDDSGDDANSDVGEGGGRRRQRTADSSQLQQRDARARGDTEESKGSEESSSRSGGNNNSSNNNASSGGGGAVDATANISNTASTAGGVVAVAGFNFVPQNDDELPLQKDQLLEVVERGEDGWWLGRTVHVNNGSGAYATMSGGVAGGRGAAAAAGAAGATRDSGGAPRMGLFPYNYVTVTSHTEGQALLRAAGASLQPPLRSSSSAAVGAGGAPNANLSTSSNLGAPSLVASTSGVDLLGLKELGEATTGAAGSGGTSSGATTTAPAAAAAGAAATASPSNRGSLRLPTTATTAAVAAGALSTAVIGASADADSPSMLTFPSHHQLVTIGGGGGSGGGQFSVGAGEVTPHSADGTGSSNSLGGTPLRGSSAHDPARNTNRSSSSSNTHNTSSSVLDDSRADDNSSPASGGGGGFGSLSLDNIGSSSNSGGGRGRFTGAQQPPHTSLLAPSGLSPPSGSLVNDLAMVTACAGGVSWDDADLARLSSGGGGGGGVGSPSAGPSSFITGSSSSGGGGRGVLIGGTDASAVAGGGGLMPPALPERGASPLVPERGASSSFRGSGGGGGGDRLSGRR